MKMAAVDPYKKFESRPYHLYVKSFLGEDPPAEGTCFMNSLKKGNFELKSISACLLRFFSLKLQENSFV